MGVVTVETYTSPIGQIFIAAHEKGLIALDFMDRVDVCEREIRERFPDASRATGGLAGDASRALERYFAGELTALDALPVDPRGTEFQRRVWQELRRIPAGRTLSYAGLARAIGQPSAVRAVGGANARNRIVLAIPCHRVIGASGALTGFASGLDRKRWLLAHENAGPRAPRPTAVGADSTVGC